MTSHFTTFIDYLIKGKWPQTLYEVGYYLILPVVGGNLLLRDTMKSKYLLLPAFAALALSACTSTSTDKATPTDSVEQVDVLYPSTATLFDLSPSGEQLVAGMAMTQKVTEIRRAGDKAFVCIEDRCAYSVALPNEKFESLLSEGQVLPMSQAIVELDGVELQ